MTEKTELSEKSLNTLLELLANSTDNQTEVTSVQSHDSARVFYAYVTPVIIVLGLLGNTVALVGFVLPPMRQLSMSIQLAAMAVSDTLVLLVYVLVEWLRTGLPVLGGAAINLTYTDPACQAFLYISYTARAMSAWLVTSFSIQHCLVMYRPKSQPAWCIICGLLCGAALVCIYKPLLSDAQQHHICGSKLAHTELSFYLDLVYGLSITILPSAAICVCNSLILQRMCRADHRTEFTLTIMAVTFTYVCLNLPYFVCWLRLGLTHRSRDLTDHDHVTTLRSDLLVTKTIFYINYSLKALLHVLTARNFRTHMTQLCQGRKVKHENLTMATNAPHDL